MFFLIVIRNWSHHIKTIKHQTNVPTEIKQESPKTHRTEEKDVGIRVTKHCNYFGVNISYKNLSHQIKTKVHQASTSHEMKQESLKTHREDAKGTRVRVAYNLKKGDLVDLIYKVKHLKFSEHFLRGLQVKQLRDYLMKLNL